MLNKQKLGPENTGLDLEAKALYDLHRNEWDKPKEGWPPFAGLTRKDRDYWRALTTTSEVKDWANGD